MSEPRVWAVIPNWNGARLLPACLDHLLATRYGALTPLVVDNGSKDGSLELLRRYPKVETLALPENRGFAKACNLGIKRALDAGAELVVLLNNDAETRELGWLASLVETARARPKAGVLGCRLVYPDGRDQELGRRVTASRVSSLLDEPGWTPPSEPFAADAAIGAVFAVTRRCVETIGLLDEGFFLGMEDTDYCLRARRAGFEVVIDPRARVVHHRSATINQESYLQHYPLDRSTEVRFRLLNNPLWSLPMFAAGEARFLAGHLVERKDRRRPLSPCNLKAREHWREFWRGFLDGYAVNLRALPEILRKRYARTERQWY